MQSAGQLGVQSAKGQSSWLIKRGFHPVNTHTHTQTHATTTHTHTRPSTRRDKTNAKA